MVPAVHPGPESCTCLAARQAARHLGRFYGRFPAVSGSRMTQFSIPARLNAKRIRREGLITAGRGSADRRSKELRLTDSQARFDAAYGSRRAADLRALMRAVTSAELRAKPVSP